MTRTEQTPCEAFTNRILDDIVEISNAVEHGLGKLDPTMTYKGKPLMIAIFDLLDDSANVGVGNKFQHTLPSMERFAVRSLLNQWWLFLLNFESMSIPHRQILKKLFDQRTSYLAHIAKTRRLNEHEEKDIRADYSLILSRTQDLKFD